MDKATHFCNLDCHDIAPSTKVNIYQDIDFRPSRLYALYVSIYPPKIGFLFLKHKHCLVYPLDI